MAKSPIRQIAVIGAGWAGSSAALSLQQQGHRVWLLEASRHAGGRARRVMQGDQALDNGQHILLGAYSACLQMMRLAGIDPAQALLRLPLQMIYPDAVDGMQFQAGRWPAPLHLLQGLWQARGLSRADKMALARFSSAARWMGWQLYHDCSVSELLERFGQTERLSALMWHPLCVAALNTRPQQASAQIFLNVLRDSLGAGRHASDMLIPRTDLSSLLPDAAIARLGKAGAQVLPAHPVRALQQQADGWRLVCQGGAQATALQAQVFDQVIIATDIRNAERLLDSAGTTASFPQHGFEAITTVYLQYPPELRLPRPALALLEAAEAGWFAQFVFDRGQLAQDQAGLLAAVISSPLPGCPDDHRQLAALVGKQLAQQFARPELASPLQTRAITEKRATYSCAAGVQRPLNQTGLAGLWLAGDYTRCDYPATLEAAVRSGMQAAALAGA